MSEGSSINQSDRFESLFGSLDLEPLDPGHPELEAEDLSDAFASVFVQPHEITVDLEIEPQKPAPPSKRLAELPLPAPDAARTRAERQANVRSIFWALLLATMLMFALSHQSELSQAASSIVARILKLV